MTRILLSLLFAAPGIAISQPEDPDRDVERVIAHELREEDIRTVQVSVAAGTVTLSGTAKSAWEKERAEELARNHSEVQAVVNRIELASGRSDQAIAEDVARRLRNYVHYSIFDHVGVQVENGVVTLTGKVTWGYKAEEMAKMAARVPGVQRVENRIEVLPNSIHDEQLRGAIASRLYGDSTFVRYSTQASPPIHIIVEHGRVTLTGYVASQLEKTRAEHIARQTFGVFSVDNQLQVESE